MSNTNTEQLDKYAISLDEVIELSDADLEEVEDRTLLSPVEDVKKNYVELSVHYGGGKDASGKSREIPHLTATINDAHGEYMMAATPDHMKMYLEQAAAKEEKIPANIGAAIMHPVYQSSIMTTYGQPGLAAFEHAVKKLTDGDVVQVTQVHRTPSNNSTMIRSPQDTSRAAYQA